MTTAAVPTGPAQGLLARRIALGGSLLIALVLIGICVATSMVTSGTQRQAAITAATERAATMASFVDAFDASSRELALRSFAAFQGMLPGPFSADAQGTMRSGEAALNGRFDEVDRFQALTGGVATVFLREGEDFRRISTSLRKENGDRAMGTLLGTAHPAYKVLNAGQPYTGRATLFGKPYMTHYAPVRDAGGRLVGLLFIGFDIGTFQKQLADMLAGARLFDSGGLVVVDPKGAPADASFVFHPQASGRKVLEVQAGAQALLDRLQAQDGSLLANAAPLLDGAASERWQVAQRSAATGWWIVADFSAAEAMASHRRTLLWYAGLLGGAALLLGGGLAAATSRWIARPLRQALDALEALANGDLTHAAGSHRRDEVGALLRGVDAMRQRFVGLLGEVRQASHSIDTAAGEIAAGNLDLSQRTEQTASNLQTAAGNLQQLTGTVEQTAAAATTANQLASSASETAQRGGRVVAGVVSTMDEIHASSQKIADIIGTIDGIAFQTNILALNAAVEAARAGEQGRGFAVVAGEVRSLAQRSAEAAKEIKTLIGASVERVETGSRLVRDAGTTMGEIVASVQRVTDIIGEITAASGEQSQGIAQVNRSVVSLDQMTQQNAALVEQSAAAAESLKGQASRLTGLMAAFALAAHRPEPALR
ncbi:Cache 3/Cache 2 fusion domain-containing protein [Aquincola sp. MAHUQ-54]|uniref:Cache 3/Cache 2 fusion domain-containing protein n=1 Tax=Aquincola agrisoli TaxID=3119538 RepID=A0AAW9Q2M5_9BURK